MNIESTPMLVAVQEVLLQPKLGTLKNLKRDNQENQALSGQNQYQNRIKISKSITTLSS